MKIERLPIKIINDPKKVILQYLNFGSPARINRMLNDICGLGEEAAAETLKEVVSGFGQRHRDLDQLLINNYQNVIKSIELTAEISDDKKKLIGAYFSKEYSIEAAALFNPSIVEHPDQSGLNVCEKRFVLSLRATGEGHISSVEFRSGVISAESEIILDPVSKYSSLPAAYSEISPENNADYELSFDEKTEISERVIFPYSGAESVGMEDARFVKFTDEDGKVKYYGTYTAYNGRTFGTQLIETADFRNFKIRKMSGGGIKDKGMALFPEKVNGKYMMISRQDGENIFIMKSDSVYAWQDAEKILTPEYNWEFTQMGNCGSPLKTEKGWLLITHAVGPVRKYVISACLLDLNDPTKVLGRLDKPLISPNEDEREGYVPNVVYSCGAIINNGELIIPYAMSDAYSGFAKVNLNELLNEILKK